MVRLSESPPNVGMTAATGHDSDWENSVMFYVPPRLGVANPTRMLTNRAQWRLSHSLDKNRRIER